jgi:hypothetical protein
MPARCVEPTTQSRVDACCRCGCAVWRALSSPEGPIAICIDCLPADVEQAVANGSDVKVAALTEEQLEELRKYFT